MLTLVCKNHSSKGVKTNSLHFPASDVFRRDYFFSQPKIGISNSNVIISRKKRILRDLLEVRVWLPGENAIAK